MFWEYVDFHLKNVNKFNHGILNVTYKNAVFNLAGYLTHDIAVAPGFRERECLQRLVSQLTAELDS